MLDQPAGIVLGKNVVLNVDRMLRRSNQLRAQQQAVGTEGHDAKSRLSRMLGVRLGQGLSQPRRGGLCERGAAFLWVVGTGRQRRATAKRDQQRRDEETMKNDYRPRRPIRNRRFEIRCGIVHVRPSDARRPMRVRAVVPVLPPRPLNAPPTRIFPSRWRAKSVPPVLNPLGLINAASWNIPFNVKVATNTSGLLF